MEPIGPDRKVQKQPSKLFNLCKIKKGKTVFNFPNKLNTKLKKMKEKFNLTLINGYA